MLVRIISAANLQYVSLDFGYWLPKRPFIFIMLSNYDLGVHYGSCESETNERENLNLLTFKSNIIKGRSEQKRVVHLYVSWGSKLSDRTKPHFEGASY